jgi:hypothetical protein
MNMKLTVRTIISEIVLYRGISDFTKGYQSRSNTVKDEKGYRLPQYFGELEEPFL